MRRRLRDCKVGCRIEGQVEKRAFLDDEVQIRWAKALFIVWVGMAGLVRVVLVEIRV